MIYAQVDTSQTLAKPLRVLFYMLSSIMQLFYCYEPLLDRFPLIYGDIRYNCEAFTYFPIGVHEFIFFGLFSLGLRIIGRISPILYAFTHIYAVFTCYRLEFAQNLLLWKLLEVLRWWRT